MGITFLGLLYMQFMYMKNVVSLRNEQFSEGVKRSLYQVSKTLELDEARRYLLQDLGMTDETASPLLSTGGNQPGQVDDLESTAQPASGSTLNIPTTRSIHQRSLPAQVRAQYLYQRGVVDEVVLDIISQTNDMPIEKRADSATVAQLLKDELSHNGITLPFEFAIVGRMGVPVYSTAGFNTAIGDKNSMFVQALFPNDNRSRVSYLKIYFPDKRDFIFHSIRFIAPTFVLTIILLIMFLYTIIVAFRQKKLTEMKNDFINNMTHEFKTPISSISLAAQMLNDNSVRKSPKMLEHISNVINDETKRLRFQVEKVLQMSMFERQKASLHIQEIDANVVISNVVHTSKLKVEKYGGTIRADLDAENALIEVDEMHFTNVVFNLLDNAIKYRRENVPLDLAISTRDLSGNRLEITVADNGIGIKKDDLKRVFEKFYRVSTGNLHDVKGFGLGLTYVNKMIREFGGTISATSELGKGTKFLIILPLTKI